MLCGLEPQASRLKAGSNQALARDYVLIGKETSTGQSTDFTLKTLSTGSLRAELYDTNGTIWQADTVDSVADGNWHAVALVVDRENASLSLYIDGQLRGVSPMPAGFGALRNLGQPLEFACFDADGPAGTAPEEFPGTLDEIRISSTAHNAEKLAADFFGHDEPQVTRVVAASSIRPASGAVPVKISGYGLAGVKVTANQPGVTVTIISNTPTALELSVTLSSSVPSGPIQLSITDVLGRTASVELQVAERTTQQRALNAADRTAWRDPGRRPPDLSPPGNRMKAPGGEFRSSRPSVGGQR